MAKTHSATEPRASARRGLATKRLQAGTTLVEILVVIVIFLIGILAVVQIFPRGFRLLLTTRNNSVATALGRDTIERLKDNPDLIPDEIVPVRYDSSGNPYIDTSIDPLALGPLGDGIGATGILTNGGAQVTKDWMLSAGPNVARRIVGEGHRLPAPREVGSIGTGAQRYENYGGLLVLDHGPVAVNSPLVAYANDLSRTIGAPRDTAIDTSSAGQVSLTGTGGNFTGQATRTPVSVAPYEFFAVNADTPDAAVYVPANHLVSRTYRVRMSAYVGTPASVKRYDYISLSVTVPAVADLTVPLVRVPLAPLLNNTTEVQSGGGTVYAVESESIRVAPQYVNLSDPNRPAALRDKWTTASTLGLGSDTTPLDPFEMKVIDGNLGVLLFSPAGREGVVDRPGGVSEPLTARVDYDVRDWRIIGEDFRVVDGTQAYTYPLGLQSLKVGSNASSDGLVNGGIFGASRTVPTGDSYDPSPTPRDNVVVQDLTTGFEVQRYVNTNVHGDGPGGASRADADANGTDPTSILVSVDKSRGSITLNDADTTTTTLDVRLIVPTGGTIVVPAKNRTFRVLYRARQEWAIQILKGASQYTLINSIGSPLAPDQAFVGNGDGGTLKYRIYFPASEAGHKVTVDRIAYTDLNGNQQVLEGQDFVLRKGGLDPTSLAYADLTEVVAKDASANKYPAFSTIYGTPVQGVKGASLSVRVLWNPETFNLSTNATDNISRADQWGRGWRKSTTETYLRAEETR